MAKYIAFFVMQPPVIFPFRFHFYLNCDRTEKNIEFLCHP